MSFDIKEMPQIPPQPPDPDVLDLFDEASLSEIPITENRPRPQSSGKVLRFDEEAGRAFGALPLFLQSSLNTDSALKKRFESILVTYLKDIRDELETRDRLSAKVEQGGMGFDFDTIEGIFNVLRQPIVSLEPLSLTELPAPVVASPSLPLLITPIDIAKIQGVAKDSGDKPKIPQPPIISEASSALPVLSLPFSPRPAPTGGPKPAMVDIAHPPKLVNPTDEFAMLDLADMRRRGAGGFAEYVLDRIEKISRDEFANRRAAISSWRSSSLYRRYIAIGKETLKSGADVRTYLAGHSDGLTYEEFEVISRLNEKLRF